MTVVLPATFSNKSVRISSSKSYFNRALIVASVFKETVEIESISDSMDSQVLLQNLNELGLNIDVEDNKITINGSFPECEESRKTDRFNLGEGGTTFRFFLSLVSRGKLEYEVDVHEGLENRPHVELFKCLEELSVSVSDNYPIIIKGCLKPQDLKVDCTQSSQFASSLRLATFDMGMKVEPINLKNSVSYWNMTEKVISELTTHKKFVTPVDFSSLANIVALGCLNEGVHIENCHSYDELQSDAKILDFLKTQNIHYELSSDGLKVDRALGIVPFKWNCSDCLDLVPVLAVFAAMAKGESMLMNVENLEFKESNRIKEITMILECFGVLCAYKAGSLVITSMGELRKLEEITPAADHRMIMMASLLMILAGGGKIHQTESVNKSFPTFFEIVNE